MTDIKKIKIGTQTYDIKDATVGTQITDAINALDSSATVAAESAGTITITKTVAETDGKIGNGTGSTSTYTTTKIDDLDAATLQAAKDHADDLISGLGTVLKFAGTVADETTLKAITSAKKGDVYIVTADSSEWVCTKDITAADASAWEKFGTTDVKNALYKDSNTFTDGYILKADGIAGKVKAVAADASAVGLGNVTNNAQVKGLASGTTNGHIVAWGADGYTVKDGGVLGSAAHEDTTAFDAAGAASTALESAKDYATAEDARLYATQGSTAAKGGNHTHTVSASGSITPSLTPTTKYLTAALAEAPAVTLSGNTNLVKDVQLHTGNLVTGSIAANGMVTGVSTDSKTCYTASYDTTNQCLNLTAVTFDAVKSVTKNASAITYATGAVAVDGEGDAVGTSITPDKTGSVTVSSVSTPDITLTAGATSTTGSITYLQQVAGAATSVSVSGTAAAGGAHTHDIAKNSAQ